MPLVASVDYSFPNPRIYLGPDSVGVDLDTRLVWQEVATRRLTNPVDRGFDPIIKPGGYKRKRPGFFTERFVELLRGCRIVPFDVSQTFTLVRDTFTDDGLSNTEVFDLAPLSPSTQIHVLTRIEEREVVVVTVAGSNVITGDIADVPAQVQSGMDQQGYTNSLAGMMDFTAKVVAADVVYDHPSQAMIFYERGTQIELMRKDVTGPCATDNASAVQP